MAEAIVVLMLLDAPTGFRLMVDGCAVTGRATSGAGCA